MSVAIYDELLDTSFLEEVTGELITLGSSVCVRLSISWIRAPVLCKFKSRNIFSFILFKYQYIVHLLHSRHSVWPWVLRGERLRHSSFFHGVYSLQSNCIKTI